MKKIYLTYVLHHCWCKTKTNRSMTFFRLCLKKVDPLNEIMYELYLSIMSNVQKYFIVFSRYAESYGFNFFFLSVADYDSTIFVGKTLTVLHSLYTLSLPSFTFWLFDYFTLYSYHYYSLGCCLSDIGAQHSTPLHVAQSQNRQRLFYFMSMFVVGWHGNFKSLLNAKVLILLCVEERLYGVIIL